MSPRVDMIHPGIARIRLALPGGKPGHVNTYLFLGRHPLLFDTGMKQTANDLEEALGQFGLTFSDLDHVILSHRHFDHYGAGALIVRRASRPVPMLAHESEAPMMAVQNGLGLTLPDLWRFLTLTGLPLRYRLPILAVALLFKAFAKKIRPTRLVGDGDKLTAGDYAARILVTPGHSEGVLCLYLPEERLLFSSDHLLSYLPHSDPYLFHLKGEAERYNQEDYFASLDAVLALDPVRIFPGHGDPVTDPATVVSGYRREYRKKDEAILHAISQKPRCTVYDIVCRLFPKVLGPMNGFQLYIALSEVYTHVQVLVRDNIVCSDMDKGEIRLLPHPGARAGISKK